MSKPDLSNVTLLCADCVETERAVIAIEQCRRRCNFGAVKLLTSLDTPYPHTKIRPLNTLNEYSAWCLKEMWKYVETTHVLVVQYDGFVLNGDAWREHWLNYDYIGPLFLQETTVNEQTVGSGGFSMRSAALMKAVAEILPEWNGSNSYWGADGQNNWGHEDGVICKHLHGPLTGRGFKFAPPGEAAIFGQGGNPVPEYQFGRPFGYHGLWPNIDFRFGNVYPFGEEWVRNWVDAGWHRKER